MPVKNKEPLVSVLIPAYNAEKYIDEAIESVVDQTYKNLEILILDDCSTDGTGKVIKKWVKKDSRIKYIKNEDNLKLSRTLNKGLELCNGEYIARMDADDWSYPDRISSQIKYLESNVKIGAIGGTIELCDEELKNPKVREYFETDGDIRKKIFRYSPFAHPAVVFRKSVLDSAGDYSESLVDAEDYDLYFRIGKYSEFANISDTVLKYRVVATSASQTRGARQERLALYIRLKAVFEYGYRMSFSDSFYFLVQTLSHFIIPFKLKFWLYNKLRKFL